MPTRNGHIKNGVLFRSSHLAALPEEFLINFINDNKIKTIIDFRTPEEIMTHGAYPSSFLENVNYLNHPVYCEGIPVDERLKNEKGYDGIGYLYYHLLSFDASFIRLVFDTASSTDNIPMIVHCIAGKDRTGISIALLLLSLGTPIDIVKEDYLISAPKQSVHFDLFIDELRAEGGLVSILKRLGIEDRKIRKIEENITIGL